ncbi:hypothetical protein AO968_02375 [Pseudomonas aeruginosa]|nr:hypothetical protein AO968_02375 [Pseudomonas aeruginosa]
MEALLFFSQSHMQVEMYLSSAFKAQLKWLYGFLLDVHSFLMSINILFFSDSSMPQVSIVAIR